MNSLPFCVFLAFLLAYMTKIPVGIAMGRDPSGFNNKDPRWQQAQLRGWGRRAVAAHHNSLETFPFFAAAATLAWVQRAPSYWAIIFAWIFIVSRLFYPFFYILNLDSLRSTAWVVSFLSICGLFFISIWR